MSRIVAYLRIPCEYAGFLRGLRWAGSGEAIEHADGRTFALSPQLAAFLEGLTTAGQPLHFAFVLHLLHMLLHGEGDDAPAPELARVFRETGQPHRNAGVLCAVLCRDVPPLAAPPDMADVCRLLCRPARMAECAPLLGADWGTPAPERVPPWSEPTFQRTVLQALAEFTPEGLRHWMRHGRGPLNGEGEQLARALPAGRPRTLGHVLAELTRRPRLAGSVPFVAQMVSALTLPPRRLDRPELALGGYADVSTRGKPEQLLPSQLVLDDAEAPGGLSLEFIRRYAENELLYFRREEPQAHVREELVLLLDQGVRTWGDVRLMLGAAALAFGKVAGSRKMPVWVAGTSSGGKLLDPLRAQPEELAHLVEASDLSANPGLALEHVLQERAALTGQHPVATDIVLLTHPRSLAEADVAAAAARRVPGARLFALCVDQEGAVELAELRHGAPVRLSRFRLDRPPEPAPLPASRPAEPAGAMPPWQGDVEPVPFPFRFGLGGGAERPLFAFDQEGEWVLQAGSMGMLHAWRSDGSEWEVLPRGYVDGTILTKVHAVLGVAGGFVVAGLLPGGVVAVHYDLGRRRVRAHSLRPIGAAPRIWSYFPDLHCVAARRVAGSPNRSSVRAVDLASGSQWGIPDGPMPERMERVFEACRRAETWGAFGPHLQVLDESSGPTLSGPTLLLNQQTGRLTLRGVTPEWQSFVPLSDGLPVFRDATIPLAHCQGYVLAAVCSHRDAGSKLRLFRGPEGIPIGQLQGCPQVALSSDGRRLARQINRCTVEVRDIEDGLAITGMTPRGGFPEGLRAELGEYWLALQVGRTMYLLHWDRDRLEVCTSSANRRAFFSRAIAGAGVAPSGASATAAALPPFVHYDRDRFRQAARGRLVAVVDVFGQVAMFTHGGDLVCMFFAVRGQVAGWMPDGTRLGPASLGGQPPTPGAVEKIAAALRRASEPKEARP